MKIYSILMLLVLSTSICFGQKKITNRYGLYLYETENGFALSDRERSKKNDTIAPNTLYARLIRQADCFEPYYYDSTQTIIPPQAKIRTEEFFVKQLVKRSLKVKVDLPDTGNEPFPFVIYIHGGGWHIGNEDSHIEQSKYFAANGIAGVRLSYTLIPEGGNIEIVKREIDDAIKIVFANASRLNLDTTRFGFCGSSAGGYLSSYKAMTTPGTKFYLGICGLYDPINIDTGYFPGREGQKKFFGTNNSDSLLCYSPIDLVPENPPMTLLMHGTADPTINCLQAKKFADEIRNKGGQAELALYEGYGHLFSLRKFADVYESLLKKQLAFVRHSLGISDKKASRVFRPADRVSFVGNSITQQGNYLQYLATYYATRYPDIALTFNNAGVSGDTSEDINHRMEEDILTQRSDVAVVMSGMNDAFRYEQNSEYDVAESAKRAKSCIRYESAYSNMIKSLTSDGRRLVLMTPSIYDDTALIPDKKANIAINPTLEQYAKIVKGFSSYKNNQVVDIWHGLLDINRELQKEDPTTTIISNDRVHPGREGGFAMAYLFLKEIEKKSIVSTVEINAKKRITEIQNGSLANLKCNAQEVSFSLLERSLPFPVDSVIAKIAKQVHFDIEFNSQILKVTDLRKGDYELFIDGQNIGRYSDVALNTGVDLSRIRTTPQYKQAAKVALLCGNLRQALHEIRQLQYIEYQKIGSGIDVNDVNMCLERAEVLCKDTDSEEWLKERCKWYMENKPKEGILKKRIEELHTKIYTEATPNLHYYCIQRVK